MFDKREFYKEIRYIAVPITLQSLFQSSVSVIDQIMAVTPHFFHQDRTFGKRDIRPLRVKDGISVCQSQIIKRVDHLAHARLPVAAVHDLAGFVQRDTCQHGDTGLSAKPVVWLGDQLHAVDAADWI